MHKRSWNDLTLGQQLRVPFSVSAEDMRAFASLSKDVNPIHMDDAYAKQHGFSGRVVYGALIVAHASRFLGMELPGLGWIWHSLSFTFHSPLYVGESANLSGSVSYVSQDLGVIRLTLEVLRDQQVLARGEVQAGQLRETSPQENAAS